jgi:PDZ domain-containing protein
VRRILVVLLLVAGAGLLARGAFPCDIVSAQPTCYVALYEGPTENTFELVDVRGEATTASAGEFLLTTVAVNSDLTVWEWLDGSFSSEVRVVQREVLFPDDADVEEVRRENAALMEESQIDAVVAALRALGQVNVEPEADGAEITEVLEDSPAAHAGLEVGEVITAVGGEPTRSADAVIDALSEFSIDDDVSITLRGTDGAEHVVAVALEDSLTEPGRATLGVIVMTHHHLPTDVSIDERGIAGPSGGLMFAVTIVDLLSDEDLTGGSVIAGTGIINRQGLVGAIGGVQQKILGALNRADDLPPAEVFLVPRGNFEEAKATPVDREVLLIPVDSLGEALAALRGLLADQRPEGALALGP